MWFEALLFIAAITAGELPPGIYDLAQFTPKG
jgi:hypothetical protein